MCVFEFNVDSSRCIERLTFRPLVRCKKNGFKLPKVLRNMSSDQCVPTAHECYPGQVPTPFPRFSTQTWVQLICHGFESSYLDDIPVQEQWSHVFPSVYADGQLKKHIKH